jgi:LysR family transcriptional regulator, low CO2-responsive transcriptional regulator
MPKVRRPQQASIARTGSHRGSHVSRTTLRRLEVFVAVVDSGGFRACSDRLDISPAAVSHQVSQLEEEIGCTLFVRRRGKLCGLTEHGTKAYREACDLLGHATAFANVMVDLKPAAVRRLSVFSDAILDGHLAKPIAAFASEHPSIDIALKRSYFEEMVHGIGSGNADMAYFYSSGRVNEIASEFAWWEPVAICARHDHPVFSKQNLRLGDLREFPFVAPPNGCHFRRSVDALLRKHGLGHYNVALETGHANIAREAVIGGYAISAVITRYLNDDLASHGVRAVEIAERDLALEVRRAMRGDLVLDNTTAALTRRLEKTAPARRAV